ncbi:MAG: autotransporter domain-containing protein [Planctomycetes bacterium]|nr:autotransporter domain-containing protein [Planctomycetota bacterium]
MQSVSSKNRVLIAARVGGLALLLAGNAHADFTWNGSGISDLWTEGANWVGGIAPPLDVTGQGLIFGATGAAQAPDAAADNYLDVGSIAFTGATFSLTLIGTGTLSFSDGATITNDSFLIQAINIDLIGNGASLVLDAAAGDLNIGGAIDLSDTGGVELSVLGANDVVLNGIISGSGGSLLKQGAGMLTLSRANTYTGGTTLELGTIVLGHNRALGTGDLSVTGNSAIQSSDNSRRIGNDISIDSTFTLTFSGVNDLTLNGEISGDGALAVNTADVGDTLTLRGDNTYTGGTTLTQGTIVLGHDNALGTGDLTLAGANTAIQSNNNARDVGNDIVNGGNLLTVSGTNDLTLSGVISGLGGLTLDSSGSLTLAGVNTYIGDTEINSGELILEGSVAGVINVNDGGTLSGGGSLGGNLANRDGGTISPGDGIGTLTVGGRYEQLAGSTLLVELSADDGSSDLLDITDDATLHSGSTIQTSLIGDGFIVTGQTFTIIEADGGITDLGADITTDSATVTIQLARDQAFTNGDTSYAIELLRAANAYSAAANPGNSFAIGEALDSLISIANNDPMGTVGDLLGKLDTFNAADYNTAVRQLSPEPYNVLTAMAVDNAQAFTAQQSTYLSAKRSGIEAWTGYIQANGPRPGSLALAENDPWILAAAIAQADAADADRLATANENRWSSYAKFQSIFSDQDTSANRTGYDATMLGGQVGFDYSLTPNFAAGLALGFTATSADLDGGLGEIDDDTVRAGPYMSFTWGDWYVDGSLTFGYHFYNGQRSIPSLPQTASSDYAGYDVTGYFGGGYHIELEHDLRLTPMASVQYSSFEFEGFTETGAGGANLTVGDRHAESLRTRLGINLSFKIDGASKILPYLYFGWEHELFDDDDIEASFAAGGNPFIIDTGARATDSIFFGAGLSVLVDYNVSAFLRFETATAADGDVGGIAAGVSVVF